MTVNILTLFPGFFEGPLQTSILGKAIDRGLVKVNLVNIRDFAADKHKATDDRPFGGGPGMIMKVEPIDKALESLGVKKGQAGKLILLLSARGKQFNQQWAKRLATLDEITLICGHYGDVDQRVADYLVDDQVSIGEFILTGGEPGALVIVDAVSRLVPGVLGNESSLEGETHSEKGLVSSPAYTRPSEYKGWKVPKLLLSGNHQKIKEWKEQSKIKN